MDDSLRCASLVAFYFDSRVATTTPPTTPETITDISYRAYRDLSRTLHGIGTHPDKTTLLENTHASLYEFVTKLETDPLPAQDVEAAQEELDTRHDDWCLKTMKLFNDHPHTYKGKKFDFSYGQAQKWINMTCKYLAVLDHPTITRVYRYLHIPIDSIVCEEANHPTTGLGVPPPPGDVSWSRLNQDQYRDYQWKLRAAITTRSDNEIAPLDWEAQAWITHSPSPPQTK